MDSLSTSPEEKQPDQSQPSAQPAPDAAAQPPVSGPPPEEKPAIPAESAALDKAGKTKSPAKLPDEAPIAATPKIDLANPGTESASAPVPAAPAEPAPAPEKDLAGYEATAAAAVLPAEARPAVMAQTAKPRRSVWLWVVLAVVILAALGGGAYWYLNRSSNQSAGAPSPSPSSNIALTSPSPSVTPSPSESPTPSATPAPSASPTPAPLTASIGGDAVAANQAVSVTTNRPVFSGTAAPGSTVTLTVAPENIGLTATTDTNGAWTITPGSDLPNGDHGATVSDGTSQLAFQLSVNPEAASAPALSQTGDPVAYVSLLAAFMLIASLAGLRLVRRHG